MVNYSVTFFSEKFEAASNERNRLPSSNIFVLFAIITKLLKELLEWMQFFVEKVVIIIVG